LALVGLGKDKAGNPVKVTYQRSLLYHHYQQLSGSMVLAP
jgi:hypothetical protein